MQLRLTLDEIRLLYEILHARGSELCQRLSHEPADIPALGTPQVTRRIDFDSDDLDCVCDVLRGSNDDLHQQITIAGDSDVKRVLQRRQVVLRTLLDKVSEACAML